MVFLALLVVPMLNNIFNVTLVQVSSLCLLWTTLHICRYAVTRFAVGRLGNFI